MNVLIDGFTVKKFSSVLHSISKHSCLSYTLSKKTSEQSVYVVCKLIKKYVLIAITHHITHTTPCYCYKL